MPIKFVLGGRIFGLCLVRGGSANRILMGAGIFPSQTQGETPC